MDSKFYQDLVDYWKKVRDEKDNVEKWVLADDEYYNHERKFIDKKGKKWTDVTTNISKR